MYVMFWERFVELCNINNTKPNRVAKELDISSGSVTGWKNGAKPRDTVLKKIADYFNVTVDYLISDNIKPVENQNTSNSPVEQKTVTETELKVALFGGDGEVTDEMWDEVKRFAEFVKQNKGKK